MTSIAAKINVSRRMIRKYENRYEKSTFVNAK